MILFIRISKRVKHLRHGLTKKYSFAHWSDFILKFYLDAVIQQHSAFFETQRIGYRRRRLIVVKNLDFLQSGIQEHEFYAWVIQKLFLALDLGRACSAHDLVYLGQGKRLLDAKTTD